MKKEIYTVVLALLATTMADKPNWYNLKTHFSMVPLFGFYDEPRTLEEAGSDWVKISDGCADPSQRYPGIRMLNVQESNEIVLIYDKNGFVAGVQSLVPVEATFSNAFYDFDGSKFYRREDISPYGEYYVTTAYFVDPETICTGRSQEEFDVQGTGYTLLFQVGETSSDTIKAPMTQDELASNPSGWYKHSCFVNMGDHFFTVDPEEQQSTDCKALVPIQLLYEHRGDKNLRGFVWQHVANLPGSRFEHVTKQAAEMIMNPPPDCLFPILDNPGVSSTHIYFLGYGELCLPF